jgi:hypothetical protein
MAVLSDNDRTEVWAALMRGETISIQFPNPAGGLSKAQHREVVDALDTALNNAAPTFNTAIPQPQRGILTSEQKAAYLVALIVRRYLSGS